MLCHILKTGTFKDSRGDEHTFTVSDLDKIVDKFENNHNRVPICVGHPKTNSPAYGWFNSVKRIGENLYCDFKGVQEEFKTAVKKGLFKNRSISLDSDLNIRHLAFLGGQAPAIKGLEEFCFEQASRVRNGQGGEPCRAGTFIASDVNDNENFLEFEINNFEDIENQENRKDKQVELEELQKKFDAQKAENEKLKKEIAEKLQTEKIKDFEDFCSEAVKNGNILPKHKERVINILQACSDFGTFNFADKEEDAVQSAKDFIKSIKMFDFEDIANNGKSINNFADYDGNAWANEIKKVAAENNVSETEAIRIIKGRK